jgi:aminopeptidase N
MQNLQQEVGDYPFAELDVVDAPGAFAGIEYPGEIYIGVVEDTNFLERVVVHETGHQWFYSVIGDDQLLQPWLDEAAASYTEVLYEEKAHGAQAAQNALQSFRDELKYTKNPNLPIGLPVSSYATQNDYGILVYAKGALFFDTLRHTLGDATFFAFLKAYYAKYRYGFVSSADFEATAEQTCSCNLKNLFDLWVYQGGAVNP